MPLIVLAVSRLCFAACVFLGVFEHLFSVFVVRCLCLLILLALRFCSFRFQNSRFAVCLARFMLEGPF